MERMYFVLMRKHNVLGIDILQQKMLPSFVHTMLSYMVRQEDNKLTPPKNNQSLKSRIPFK